MDRLLAIMQSMQQLYRAQEVTANNLANVQTSGYKADQLFYEAFTEQLNGTRTDSVRPYQVPDLRQGVLEETGNPFDVALEGSGFFQVEKDGHLLLTRNGHFRIDDQGYLIDMNGGQVQGSAGSIHIPEYYSSVSEDGREPDFRIAGDGTIRVNGEIQDQLRIRMVEQPQSLERRAGTYFTTKDGSVLQKPVNTTVNQGYLESGNVESLDQMVDMMSTLRLFESQQRAMMTTNDVLSKVSTQLGQL